MRWPFHALLLCLAAGTLAWTVTDRLEAQNDFCTSCHLPSGDPLHQQLREDFDRVIPVSLAGVHGRGWVEEREDSAFRCIDCHAGSGPIEQSRVKLNAGWDGLRYLVGSFEEPQGMPFDLSPETCRRCHPTFRGSAAPGWTLEAYHGRPDHDAAADVPACVACHEVHGRDGDGIVYFMARDRVDRQCRACHSEEGGPSVTGKRGAEAPRAFALSPKGGLSDEEEKESEAHHARGGIPQRHP